MLQKEERERANLERMRLEEEETRRTGGVSFVKSLIWLPRPRKRTLLGNSNDSHNVDMMDAESSSVDDDGGVDSADSGDKITLPQSCLHELNREANLQYPLFFELSTGTTTKVTHAGVLEFVAEEGTVQLPKKSIASLGLVSGSFSQINVKYVRLPKGTYAKLKVHPSNESRPSFLLQEENQSQLHALLELALRTEYATLTIGDVLPIATSSENLKVEVLALRPAKAVSILETEMEVDIVYSTTEVDPNLSPRSLAQYAALSQANPDAIHPLTLSRTPGVGATADSVVQANQSRYFKFTIPPNISTLEGLQADLVLTIALKIEYPNHDTTTQPTQVVNDADIFIAPHPIRNPTRTEYYWAAFDGVGDKTLKIPLSELRHTGAKEIFPEAYYVAVIGFCGIAKFEIQIGFHNRHTLLPPEGRSPRGSIISSCDNCGQQLPRNNIMTHLMYCLRHNVRCPVPGCGAVMRKQDLELHHWHCPLEQCRSHAACNSMFERAKHEKMCHTPLQCVCGMSGFVLDQLIQHKKTVCPERFVRCRFCDNYARAGPPLGPDADYIDRIHGLTAHESQCGSRTVLCDICKQPVIFKMMEMHLQSLHQNNHHVNNNNTFASAPPPQFNVLNLPPQTNFDSRPMGVVCPICHRHFPSERALGPHIDEAHS
eukprot:TRINITY_DN1979_c0_g1_i2.p2 TRINITY_DN1979_c0_g1~~TRINITY_DN1979_c0_g1_i2.p2  ORF type:complete len:657 (-),score=59.90 TRINITY_DN1979_c0_g1_i2:2794-4764(-)